MAYIVPSDISQLALAGHHSGELETLALLKKKLSGDYTIYHGVHWSREYQGYTVFGEIDFVIVNRAGDVLVIEQKNGPLEETADGLVKKYDDGSKNVAHQLRRSLDNIREKFKWIHGAGRSLRLDYLMYCPEHNVRKLSAAALDASRIVDAAAREQLADRISTILGPGAAGEEVWLETVEGFFRQTFQLVPDVHAHITATEKALTRQSGRLAEVLGNIEMSPFRLRVRGTAGCGKTLVALGFFEDAVRRGKRPLLLCFNRPLAEKLKAVAPEGGMVETWYGLCAKFLESRGHKLDYSQMAQDPEFWTKLQDAVVAEPIPSEWRFDSLVVDEGQDFESEWFDILRLFANGDPDILWLEDANQNIRRVKSVPLVGFIGYRAGMNYRSPEPIARFIRNVLPFEFESANDLPGLGVGVATYSKADDQPKIVSKLVSDLVGQGLSHSEIAIITMRGHSSSVFSERERVGNFTLRRFTNEYDLFGNQRFTDGQLRFDSIYRFKGQQAPAVILVDVDPDPDSYEHWQRLLYAGMTRATVRLELVVNGDNDFNESFVEQAYR